VNRITVLLADDHTMVRKGLRTLLDAEVDIQVIGEAEDGREAVDKANELRPDVVVMDITMPGLNGLEATRQIRRQLPQIQVVMLTMHTSEEYVLQVLRAGATGYVVKRAAPSELISAVRAAHQGESFLSPSVSRMVVEKYLRKVDAPAQENRYEELTPREREVLQLIAEGHSGRQIAELLCLSVKTVQTHRANLMHKLDIHTTAGLTQYAIRKGVIGRTE
jgi:two-component system, NarL family, response regulator NreC